MPQNITRVLECLLAVALCAGCRERKPSADIFEAIDRKHFRESEVRDFVTADPSLVSAVDDSGGTPLYSLAGNGRISLIEFFVTHGADVNEPGYAGITPLGSACHSGEFEAAKLLLANGADPNLPDEDGETPLHQIIMWCPDEFDLFKLVVENGGRLDMVTLDGRSMLDFCSDRRKDYSDPDYSGSADLKQRVQGSYDRLETFILETTQ